MSEQYKPKKGSKYYYIFTMNNSSHVEKSIWEESELDKARFNDQNCFRSKKSAKTMLDLFGNAW